VPNPISVNMFGLRLTSEDQKRSKKGQPPRGPPASRENLDCVSHLWGEMQAERLAKHGQQQQWKRERRTHPKRSASIVFGIGLHLRKISIGSSAIPQMGQFPGPIWMISGCIGRCSEPFFRLSPRAMRQLRCAAPLRVPQARGYVSSPRSRKQPELLQLLGKPFGAALRTEVVCLPACSIFRPLFPEQQSFRRRGLVFGGPCKIGSAFPTVP